LYRQALQLAFEGLDQRVDELLGGVPELGGGAGLGVVDDVVAADGDGEDGPRQVARRLVLPEAPRQRRVHDGVVLDLLVEGDALIL
jgi:hypothetical protein